MAGDPTQHRATGRVAVIGALAAAAALWLGLGRPPLAEPASIVGLGIVLVLCLIPSTRRAVSRAIERLRGASPSAVRLMSVGVFVLTTTYLIATAMWQGRDLFPKWHDQQMTLVQMQMLARGRLWMPQHPCADFFDTFYVLVKPVYAAMYFPGAAMFFVPTVWLHLPYWLMPLLAAGAIATLIFRITTDLTDPVGGWLAVLMFLSLVIVRLLALWVMSHIVFTLLALVAVRAWMNWRRTGMLRWAICLGIALGWAAITRPVDALVYAIPLGLAVLWDLRDRPWRARLATIGVMLAAALPFIAVQLIFDRGVTGSLFQTPVQFYANQEFAGISSYGQASAGDARSVSSLAQKQQLADSFVLPLHRRFASESTIDASRRRLKTIVASTLPGAALLVLFVTGLLAVSDVRRLVLLLPVPLFLIGYTFYPVLLNQYCITIVPCVIVCVVLGIGVLSRQFPRWQSGMSAWLSVSLAVFCLTALPEFHPARPDDDSWPATWFNYEVLPGEVSAPALVLYHYEPASYSSGMANEHDEPVYNVDVAWPDDAPIIRAHDLGPRNEQIIAYYGQRQPQRNVYQVSRSDLKLHFLGKAGDLATGHMAQAATRP